MRNLTPLRLADVVALRTAGAQLLDVREPVDFAAGHLAGSVSIALSGKFATLAGTLLSHERPLVIVAEPGREREAVMRLGRIGYDDVAGYLRDGMAAVRGRLELVTVCASGYRSCIAASLLAREGFDPVADLAGGMAAWRANPPHS